MSYVVTIKRDTPIERLEIHGLTVDSAEFELDESDGVSTLRLTNLGDDQSQYFVLSDGSLHITSPSDAALTAAQALAKTLGAGLVGEEGEDLSNITASGDPGAGTGCGALASSVILIAVLLALYWLFN